MQIAGEGTWLCREVTSFEKVVKRHLNQSFTSLCSRDIFLWVKALPIPHGGQFLKKKCDHPSSSGDVLKIEINNTANGEATFDAACLRHHRAGLSFV
jgi:hypothetical protein